MNNNLKETEALFKVRWPDFSPYEVLSPDGLVLLHNQGVFPLQFSALDKLQSFRQQINKPFIINTAMHRRRGWRSPKENYKLNRFQFSFHTTGCAFDITIDGMTPQELANEAMDFGFGGIGVYRTFTHLDTRSTIGKAIIWGFK